jgi:hypothetical protein
MRATAKQLIKTPQRVSGTEGPEHLTVLRVCVEHDTLMSGRFAPIVLKNSVLKPSVIADSFRPVGAGDRIDDGSAAG